ncbi:hypothetical protein D3C79_871230 [compost metagenome]
MGQLFPGWLLHANDERAGGGRCSGIEDSRGDQQLSSSFDGCDGRVQSWLDLPSALYHLGLCSQHCGSGENRPAACIPVVRIVDNGDRHHGLDQLLDERRNACAEQETGSDSGSNATRVFIFEWFRQADRSGHRVDAHENPSQRKHAVREQYRDSGLQRVGGRKPHRRISHRGPYSLYAGTACGRKVLMD